MDEINILSFLNSLNLYESKWVGSENEAIYVWRHQSPKSAGKQYGQPAFKKPNHLWMSCQILAGGRQDSLFRAEMGEYLDKSK